MTEAECRRIVKARSRGVCERCYARRATNMSHRKPRSQGGLWEPANILELCGSGTTGCHGWVESQPMLAHRAGFRLWRAEDPLVVPLRMAGRAAWVLTNDGLRVAA